MVIKLSYRCNDPYQVVNITLTETDTEEGGCNVQVKSDPVLLPGTPNPFDVLRKFLFVLDSFELPVKSEANVDES